MNIEAAYRSRHESINSFVVQFSNFISNIGSTQSCPTAKRVAATKPVSVRKAAGPFRQTTAVRSGYLPIKEKDAVIFIHGSGLKVIKPGGTVLAAHNKKLKWTWQPVIQIAYAIWPPERPRHLTWCYTPLKALERVHGR